MNFQTATRGQPSSASGRAATAMASPTAFGLCTRDGPLRIEVKAWTSLLGLNRN